MLTIGIDIGWSERQRSCAFAAFDPLRKLKWPDRTKIYDSADLGCCRFRLSELIEFLVNVRQAMSSYARTIVIIDGPLGPKSRPISNRSVDSSFRRGEFRNRMQPADIDNKIGRTYVNATYQVVECLDASFLPWVGGPVVSSVVIAETNPTVGLALMTQKFRRESLPSRKRPLVPPRTARSERAIRAKSDFYWRVGGNRQCASILKSPKIARERNHENVAGLYCLAVASSLSSGRALACGDATTGVYVFPDAVDGEWLDDLKSVGITSGEATEIVRSSTTEDFATWSRATSGLAEATPDSTGGPESFEDLDDNLATSGDCQSLLLNDNGGIWEKHNDWLEGLDGPVRVRCKASGVKVTLKRAKSLTQWTSDPKALPIARSHGFEQPNLSSMRSIAIDIEILEVEL